MSRKYRSHCFLPHPEDSTPSRPGAERWLIWLVPSLVFLAVQWPALQVYFYADDFAWLQLPRLHLEGKSYWELVFAPAGHGTWRPFSERLTFLVFHSLFPASPLPFRILTGLTQVGSIVLLTAVMLRLTGSGLAAAAAPVLWVTHMCPTGAFAWSSAYMHVLCGFCLLLAFYCFLRYDETGQRRYLAGHWAVFLFGFGVMETNLVLPALTAAYCAFRARRRWRLVAAQAAVSAAFVAAHLWLAPRQATGVYSLHLDLASLVETFGQYVRWTFHPYQFALMSGASEGVCRALSIAVAAALGVFSLGAVWRREGRTLLFLCWYAALLAPVLPLREHLSPYYLTLATMAAGMLAAWGLASAWRWVALVLLAAWLALMPRAARTEAKWWRDLSREVRVAVTKIRAIPPASPGQAVFITAVSENVYRHAIAHGAALAMGPQQVHLTPDVEQYISYRAGDGDTVADYADDDVLRRGLESGGAIMYSLAMPRPLDVSQRTLEEMRLGRYTPPDVLNTGDLRNAKWLPEGWHQAEGEYRWTARRASAVLFGPYRAGQQVTLRGYCPEIPAWPRSIEVRLSASGLALPPIRLESCRGDFSASSRIPPALGRRHRTMLRLEVEPVFRAAGDARELGLFLRQVGFE